MQNLAKSDLTRRLTDAATMCLVALVCVFLLIYIAYGTTKRTYEQLLVEKSIAQAELVRSPLESYLRPGLPLRQFTGFNQLTTSMIDADRTLVSIIIETGDGELVFSAGDAKVRTLPPDAQPIALSGSAELRRSRGVLQVVMPLRNKFEQVGRLVTTMDRTVIDSRLISEFRVNFLVALLACLAFGVVVFRTSAGPTSASRRPIAIAFTGAFFVVSIIIIATMVSLFAAGAESKGRALVDSLGQRLDDIPQYGLQFDQLDGIDEVLDGYRVLNPEISSVGITINGRVAVHTDRSKVGRFWVTDVGQTDYLAQLTPPNHPRAAQVILSVPKNYVVWQVARNVKNYAALFVASALFAFLFLQLAQVLRAAHASTLPADTNWRASLALDLVKPVFFLAVFVDHLSYAFLPQFISKLAVTGGDPASSAAWAFTAYYLCFALALIPAGHFGQRAGSRNLVLGGLALICLGLLAMTLVTSLPMAIAARAATGLGQGVLFIGVQCFILSNAQREHRTKANGIVVYGFQGGMISGMAIGSLLVGEIGAVGVFGVAAVVALAAMAYCFALLPVDAANNNSAVAPANVSKITWAETVNLLRDPQFMQIILMVGIPAKAVLTGVVLFAMPLLLDSMGFAREDIGQITMIYAACVLLSSAFAGHRADRTQSCRGLLVWGALLTAAGLFVISLSGQDFVTLSAHAAVLKTLLSVIGLAIIGWAHGLINAPVVTHITDTAAAARIGHGPTAATYRFLERGGHMFGPIVVGQLFLVFGTSPLVLGWIGIFMTILAVAFHYFNPAETTSDRTQEFA